MSYYDWRPYVSVAQRRAQAKRRLKQLEKKGQVICPVEIDGRTIASSFWGKAWCRHLESFSYYSNRLPRGRTYVRNGSVCHLAVKAGLIEAMVSGSSLYNVAVRIKPLGDSVWKSIRRECSGRIGSLLELLQGRLSEQIMSIVTNREKGLLPLPGQIEFSCDCPDWATMCKHVAAVLYGVGNRLDSRPEDLFTLRGVDAGELITADIVLPAGDGTQTEKTFSDGQLADIFGIDLDEDGENRAAQTSVRKKSALKNAGKVRKRDIREIPAVQLSSAPGRRRQSQAGVSAGGKKQKRNSTGGRVTVPSTGAAVAALRRRSGLSVKEFAALLGVSTTTVYQWEKTSRLKLQSRTRAALKKMCGKAVVASP
ncbi:MAG: helix-turn-helix domain-containing protein [Phycisphaerae bacterium]|nr:helix-turn-helix domain-containing protein [Phycisphaerae bacterium]